MNCQDFERMWDVVLDAGPAVAGRHPERDLPQVLRDHALTCPDCRARMRSFEALHRAIQSWGRAPRPSPSADLTERILAAVAAENGRPGGLRARRFWKRGVVGLAATAAAALAIAFYPREGPPRPAPGAGPDRPVVRHEPEPEPGPKADLLALNQALADASDATWELAYAASAPAVRLGRNVFDNSASTSVAESEDRNVRPSPPGPRLFSAGATAPGEVVSDALNRFGEGISAGVRPLSDSARRALDFLQGAVPPPGDPGELPPPTSDSKGA